MRAPPVCLGLALVLLLPTAATAEPTSPRPGSAAAVEEAKQHFERALEAYRGGAYRAAIAELESALKLDPDGKDLVYNLGLVYEKLGEVDRAIAEFERYLRMETDPEEAERARTIVRRLEGARAEIAGKSAQPPAAAEPVPAVPAAEPPPERVTGRFDGWVLAAGGLAAASALMGAALGVQALGMRPTSSDATGGGTSAAELEQRARDAHDFAMIADVAFGVALVSASIGTALYLLREAPPVAASAGRSGARVEVRF